MLSLRIASRFLRRSPVQSVLIVAGIAVGLAVQIFVGSLISSLQAFLIEQTLGSTPHVTIRPSKSGGSLVFDRKNLAEIERDKRVSAVLPQRTISILYTKGQESAPLSVRGGDAKALDSIYHLSRNLTKGHLDLSNGSIVVGSEFADSYKITTGETIQVILPNGSARTLKVTGIFTLGARELNQSLAFTNGTLPAEALGFAKNEYSAIEIQLADVFESTAVARKLGGLFPKSQVSDWQIEREDLLSALEAQTRSTLIIQIFIIIAVALGIAYTLSISAIQKTRQIGILKALGMTDGKSGIVFLWQGILLGALGAIGGVTIALALIEVFNWVSRQQSGSLFPIRTDPQFMLISTIIGISVAMGSAIIPSRRTARLDPIEVIQGG
jgi:lipoprotein-releasing system permease protein